MHSHWSIILTNQGAIFEIFLKVKFGRKTLLFWSLALTGKLPFAVIILPPPSSSLAPPECSLAPLEKCF